MASLPLRKLKVLELAGLAPVPFCGMLLADFGASVTRIDPIATKGQVTLDKVCRNKKSLCIDLKSTQGQGLLSDLIKKSDILLDPYRPGVLEKFVDFDSLPNHLILCRISGFGHYDEGNSLKYLGGHDINYLASCGVLDRLTSIPMNTVADFAGGGLLAAYSVLAAHVGNQAIPAAERKAQVLDVNLTDGANYIANTFPCQAADIFPAPAGMNLLDGGCPFYQIYKTKDKKKMAVGCLEEKFYQNMIKTIGFGLEEKYGKNQMDITVWPKMGKDLAQTFASETREYWAEKFAGVDACVTPVLSSKEAAKFRPSSFQTAPRLMPKPVPSSLAQLIDVDMIPGQHSEEVLSGFGYSNEEIEKMVQEKTVA